MAHAIGASTRTRSDMAAAAQSSPAENASVVLLVCASSAIAFLVSNASVGAGWAHSTLARFAICALPTVVLCLVLRGTARLFPGNCRLVAGSPRYSYLFSAAHQAFVFPCCMGVELWAVVATGASAGDWLHSSWAGASPGRIAGHATLFAYWMADLITTQNTPLIIAHHLVCLSALSVSIAELVGPSSAVCLCGAITFEAGNVCLSLSRLYESSPTINSLSVVFMTASNVLASALAMWFGAFFDGGGAAARGVATVFALGLAAARQRSELQRWAEWRAGHRD